MHVIIVESTNGLSCSQAGRTEGLSYLDTMITPPPAARSAAHSSEHQAAPAPNTAMGSFAASFEVPFTKGIIFRSDASSIFGRIGTTRQAPTMTRATSGGICGQLSSSSRLF